MKKYIIQLSLLTTLFIIPAGCGYNFPAIAIYEGPDKLIYIPRWQNRTSKFGIDAQLYQSLARWFQQSEAINTTRIKDQADLVLAGEIISIELPSVAWGQDAITTDVRVRLTVRYVLKDLKSGELLWEVAEELRTETYPARMGTTGENKALNTIINDLSEHIYLNTLEELSRQNSK